MSGQKNDGSHLMDVFGLVSFCFEFKYECDTNDENSPAYGSKATPLLIRKTIIWTLGGIQ